MDNYQTKLQHITTFIFDFDGVLSDGKIYVLPDGDQMRATDVKDGYACNMRCAKGITWLSFRVATPKPCACAIRVLLAWTFT